MAPQGHPPRDRAATLIDLMLRAMRPQVHEDFRVMELTLQQFRTLNLLNMQGPLRMSSISSLLGVGMPTVTNLVSKLEEKGLAVREHNTSDRRVVFCSSTEAGRSEMERLWRVRRGLISQVTDLLSEEEAELVARAMELIIRGTERVNELGNGGGLVTAGEH